LEQQLQQHERDEVAQLKSAVGRARRATKHSVDAAPAVKELQDREAQEKAHQLTASK